MTLGSLFAGIGGIDLGFERAGFKTSWQVEIDPYCRRVLAKHWPHVRRHDDVKTFPTSDPTEWAVDCITGGFPCQDISYAGKGAGIAEGTRSGLWSEFARIIRVVRPRFVVVENVAALLDRGMGIVLGDLAALGFDAEWSVFSACAFGAPHTRERVFVIANRKDDERVHQSNGRQATAGLLDHQNYWRAHPWNEARPRIRRMDDGVPGCVDRIARLGNAVVPQVAEWIARRIMEATCKTT